MLLITVFSLGLALPIDGSCDSELSVKGLTTNELDIGDWTQDLPSTLKQTSTSDLELEASLEDDENTGVFFVELNGSILQVGRLKKNPTKRKLTQESKVKDIKTPDREPRQITCSECHQTGHNKRSKNCTAKNIVVF